jgi:hypothetical protein
MKFGLETVILGAASRAQRSIETRNIRRKRKNKELRNRSDVFD